MADQTLEPGFYVVRSRHIDPVTKKLEAGDVAHVYRLDGELVANRYYHHKPEPLTIFLRNWEILTQIEPPSLAIK